MKKSNIILIGMCGSGKSTIGVLLAKAMGRYFLDNDVFIQAAEGRSLQEIIDEKGIDEFCRIEEEYVICIELENAVIATGGSVVSSEKAMQYLKGIGTVIHLDLPFEMIQQRVTNLYTRGVVMEKGQTLKSLFEKRQPLYQKYAEITVDCTNKNHEQVVDTIISSL
jgi:shikimate kinase